MPAVSLQLITRGDLGFMKSIWTDFEAIKYTNWPLLATEPECAERLENLLLKYHPASGRVGPYIIRASDGTFVGMIGIEKPDPFRGEHELWYALIRSQWGQGYGSAAAEQLFRQLPASPQVTHLRATSAANNRASRKILERIGFTQTEVIPGGFVKNGLNEDTVVYNRECRERTDRLPMNASVD